MTTLFFFKDPATTELYTLSLHDALPISSADRQLATYQRTGDMKAVVDQLIQETSEGVLYQLVDHRDRKSTRLNSSHPSISYAVFCLKKKKKKKTQNKSHK